MSGNTEMIITALLHLQELLRRFKTAKAADFDVLDKCFS